jgi:hypothetical protein
MRACFLNCILSAVLLVCSQSKAEVRLPSLISDGMVLQRHPANAQVTGDVEQVWKDAVARPAAVRYAWANNPEGCNLYNQAGLPAAPFTKANYPPKIRKEK